MSMPTIVHFDLPVDDVDRAKKFYKEILDGKLKECPEKLSTMAF